MPDPRCSYCLHSACLSGGVSLGTFCGMQLDDIVEDSSNVGHDATHVEQVVMP